MSDDPRTMSYIYAINKINDELRRLNTRVKELKEYKKNQEEKLYLAMKALNIDNSGSYSKKILEKKYGGSDVPSTIKTRRTKKIKTEEAIRLFRETGIPNPDSFLAEFKKTQRTYD